jgi:peroxiredoxin
MIEFRSRHDKFAEAGIEFFGISVDSVFCHQAFVEELGGLPFELIADFERRAVTAYDVRRDDVEGYSGFASRSVFVIDSHGIIRWTWERAPRRSLPNFDEVVEVARRIAADAPASD